MTLTIAPTQDRFLHDGEPFFYLADTVWAAFPNLPLGLWPEYLARRRQQGFTAVQISILPVEHDASRSPDNLSPFEGGPGHPDFTRLNRVYFDKAEKMVAMVVDAGLVPVIGVLWGCYVPESPMCERSPVPTAMPLAAVEAYTEHVVERFGPFDPAVFVSGDTAFRGAREAEYYMTALQIVRQRRPDLLLTMHLGTAVDLPDEFIAAVDFYMYQSGHGPEQTTPYELAQKLAGARITRPVVNGEPCYEGHGRGGTHTRFQPGDVRKAIWQSLLSGARAGTAYGAHGVWSCHLPHMEFMHRERKFDSPVRSPTSEVPEFGGRAYLGDRRV